MAYVMSTGLWDSLGNIALAQLPGFDDPALEADLAAWQADYDDQFKRHPYSFDWECFNRTGVALTARIRPYLPHGADIYYEPSDDREFFSPADCQPGHGHETARDRALSLRERKRSLLHSGFPKG
jgi:hypothetical protein